MTSKGVSVDLSTWDGTLLSSDFYVAARSFAEKWNTLDSTTLPHWSWVSCTKQPWITSWEVDGYLALENVLLHDCSKENQDEGDDTENEEACCSDQDDATDDATLVPSCRHNKHYFDFHVVYSSSFKVPVLFFRAYCSDGQPMGWGDIRKDIPESSVEILNKSKWTFITQEEHPYLNRPWFTLHPCGTSGWMKLLFNCKGRLEMDQYLLSWLSVTGQAVGLKIPLELNCNLEK